MKILKKFLGLILIALTLITVSVPAWAAEADSQTYPEIYVPGFDSTVIYADRNDPGSVIAVPDKETVIEAFKNEILPALIIYAADKDGDRLGHTVSDVCNDMFGDWFYNADGTAKENSGANFVYPSKKAVVNASRLRFGYDWRGDIIQSAAQLSDYIDYVLECTGKSQVALSCHSLGANVVLAYLSIYGYDKVMGIVFDTPAIEGLTSVGELFAGEAGFSGEGIAALLKLIMGATEYEELMLSIIDILTFAGVSDSLSDFFNEAYGEISSVFFEQTMLPLFGRWPSIWTMIPDSYIDSAEAAVFDDIFAGEEYALLRDKIDAYNQMVRADKKQTLLDYDSAGRVAVISRYGYGSVLMTEKWNMLSDAVIETQNSSLGAVTAEVGECLSDEYLADKDMKYISPDRTVDASGCLFPEKTWFVKNAVHSLVSDVTMPYYKQLLFSDVEATCDNSQLPRYMLYDGESGKVSADESVPAETKEPTLFDRIFSFIKALINKLLDLFRK